MKAEFRPITNILLLSATVVAPRRSRISVGVGGLVARMAVGLGDRVSSGDLLVELDSAQVHQEVAEAEAAVAEAEARLAEDRRRLRIARNLVKKRNIAQNEVDERAAQVKISQAALKRLEAERAAAQIELQRHEVRAPFAGVVAEKVAEVGEWISPGMAVVELVASDPAEIEIPVPQSYFPNLKAGAPVAVRFDAFPEREFETEPVVLVPVSDPTDRAFILRVRTIEKDIPLTPGMSARAAIHLQTGESGVVIPRDAVIRYPDGRITVWVLEPGDPNSKVTERRIGLGLSFDGFVHVSQGLETGAEIVVRGNESLREGQAVRVVGPGG